MFWTEWDTGEKFTKSSIARANMDGTDVMRIIYQDIYWPNSLAVDYITERLFFVDAKRGLIESSNLGEFYCLLLVYLNSNSWIFYNED
jgi:hypothetical protein